MTQCAPRATCRASGVMKCPSIARHENLPQIPTRHDGRTAGVWCRSVPGAWKYFIAHAFRGVMPATLGKDRWWRDLVIAVPGTGVHHLVRRYEARRKCRTGTCPRGPGTTERWCRALASEPNSGALFTRETRPYADRLFVAEWDSGRRVGMDGRMTERWSQVSVRHGDAGRT
jgi:hypothetical protein